MSGKMASKRLILVTGASGFIGAQVVEHLLQAGYAVKGSSRSSKASILRQACSYPDFQLVILDDIIKGDFSQALAGVYGVVHIASPLPLPGNQDNFYDISVEGTLNILRQAYNAKVYKFCFLSSLGATDTTSGLRSDPSHIITDKDWSNVSKEDAIRPDVPPNMRYRASKTLAERAAWEFAETHPDMELTTLLPPFVYGPLATAQVIRNPQTTLSTNIWIYMLLSGPDAVYPRAVEPQYVDVRDVARAAVLSFSSPPVPPGVKRRFLLQGGSFTWKQAVKHIATVRPDLQSRLLDHGNPAHVEEAPAARIDTSKARDILGLTEFIGWQKTVEDTVESLLGREETWKSRE